MTRCDELIRDIEGAFRDVERGDGLTLHEAAESEGHDYCTAEERARVRALDPETRWQDIPDGALAGCLDRWAFDEEGFRFHLPAYVRWYLRHPEQLGPFRGGLLYALLSPSQTDMEDRAAWERSWDAFTLGQKRVIARFLEFMAGQGGDLAQDARLTWRVYWCRFSAEAPSERTPC